MPSLASLKSQPGPPALELNVMGLPSVSQGMRLNTACFSAKDISTFAFDRLPALGALALPLGCALGSAVTWVSSCVLCPCAAGFPGWLPCTRLVRVLKGAGAHPGFRTHCTLSCSTCPRAVCNDLTWPTAPNSSWSSDSASSDSHFANDAANLSASLTENAPPGSDASASRSRTCRAVDVMPSAEYVHYEPGRICAC